jgi:hypothetical protein
MEGQGPPGSDCRMGISRRDIVRQAWDNSWHSPLDSHLLRSVVHLSVLFFPFDHLKHTKIARKV